MKSGARPKIEWSGVYNNQRTASTPCINPNLRPMDARCSRVAKWGRHSNSPSTVMCRTRSIQEG